MSAGDGFRAFVGADVVVDTSTSYVFIGRLVEVTDHVLALQDADVHDRSESRTTKEKYVMEARKSGVRMNRKAVTVRLETVVCVSRLEDVVEY